MTNRNLSENKKNITQCFLVALLMLLVFLQPLNYYLNYILKAGFSFSFSVSPFSYALLSLLCVLFIFHIFTKKPVYALVYFVFFALTCISIFQYDEIHYMLDDLFNPAYNELFSLFVFCLPSLFLCLSLKVEIKDLAKPFVVSSFFVLVFGIAAYSVFLAKQSTIEYMTFSYNLLVPSAICFSCGKLIKTKFSLFLKLLSVVGFAIIVLSGSRGALVCTLAFLSFYFVLSSNESGFRLIRLIVIAFASMLILVFLKELVNALAGFGNKMGIPYLRNLSSILNGDFFNSEGRVSRYTAVTQSIARFPFGYGLFGDRYCVYESLGFADYTHNFVLELLCDFGILFGTLIVSFIFISTFKCLTSDFDPIYISLFAYSIFGLLFSGTMFTSTIFFVLMGITIRKLFVTKKRWKRRACYSL